MSLYCPACGLRGVHVYECPLDRYNIVELKSCKHGFMLSHCGQPPDASASVPTESAKLIAELDEWDRCYPGNMNMGAWSKRAAAELDRLARELARAQTALRDIASCRTRPPADAIEIACRYWSSKKQ